MDATLGCVEGDILHSFSCTTVVMVCRSLSEPSARISHFGEGTWRLYRRVHISSVFSGVVASVKNSATVFGGLRISPVKSSCFTPASGSRSFFSSHISGQCVGKDGSSSVKRTMVSLGSWPRVSSRACACSLHTTLVKVCRMSRKNRSHAVKVVSRFLNHVLATSSNEKKIWRSLLSLFQLLNVVILSTFPVSFLGLQTMMCRRSGAPWGRHCGWCLGHIFSVVSGGRCCSVG